MGCCLSCFTGQTDRKVAEEISAPSRKASKAAKRNRRFWSKLFRRSSSVTPEISLDEIKAKHYGRSPEPDISSSSVSSTKLSNTSAPCSTGNIGVDVPMALSLSSSPLSPATALSHSSEDKEELSEDKPTTPSTEDATPPAGSSIAFSFTVGEDALQHSKPKLPPHLAARLKQQQTPRSLSHKVPLQERMALANKRRQEQSDERRAKAQRFIAKHAEQMRRRLAAQQTDN